MRAYELRTSTGSGTDWYKRTTGTRYRTLYVLRSTVYGTRLPVYLQYRPDSGRCAILYTAITIEVKY